jgi:hypothetical protein
MDKITYRISKYDPEYKDDDGKFLHREWTSISDIIEGKNSDSFETYYKTESAYADTVRLIMQQQDLDTLILDGMEYLPPTKQEFNDHLFKGYYKHIVPTFVAELEDLKDGYKLKGEQLEMMIRLILREVLWAELLAPDLKISFGYDYYMYVTCPPLPEEVIRHIHELGLFVEIDEENEEEV